VLAWPANPNCLAANRPLGPTGAPLSIFVMDTVALDTLAAGADLVPPCGPACDPTKMAPFMVGDFVTYAGKVQRDGPAASYISAYDIAANVAIYTKARTGPAYVMIEGSLIGTMGPPTPIDFTNPASRPIVIEAQDRLKVEGFLTDPSRAVDVYAIDKSTAGVETLRYLSVAPVQPVPFGRFRLILGSRANALFDTVPGSPDVPTNTLKGAPREIMVALRIGGTPGPLNGMLKDTALAAAPAVAGGLKAGFYVAPLGEYIFPENHVMGEPIVDNNFECMPWLLFGSGPLDDAAGAPNIGPLFPWPGQQKADRTRWQ
jgi:hypothetical protein